MAKTNTVSLKSVGIFFLIVLAGLIVVVVTLNTTNTDTSQADIRSQAANQADAVVDSDALLEQSESAFQSTQTDSNLSANSTSINDAADENEVNGL